MLSRNERLEDLDLLFVKALQGERADIWTAMPGIIQSFDPVAMTCEVQVAIQAQITDPVDGTTTWINIPKLLDCPVQFPGGGGMTLTFPLTLGDECLVVFASRCIDRWWLNGGIQDQAVLRMHNLSDGFVLPGVRSQPRRFTVSTDSAQLRSDDGTAFVEIKTGDKSINVMTPGSGTVDVGGSLTATSGGNTTINAPNIILNGNVQVHGNFTQDSGTEAASFNGDLHTTGDVTAGTVSLRHHTHGGVQSGGSNTNQPNP